MISNGQNRRRGQRNKQVFSLGIELRGGKLWEQERETPNREKASQKEKSSEIRGPPALTDGTRAPGTRRAIGNRKKHFPGRKTGKTERSTESGGRLRGLKKDKKTPYELRRRKVVMAYEETSLKEP